MLLSLFILSCSDPEKKTEFALEGEFSECDPLDTGLCALPFPSSFFEKKADTPSGIQLH